ncbi:hypothetical protein HanIR_Chr13g0640251 [Helianthus annuus]|nr:hypothetical protein HanIR_Chr13g0640251 [Helianthus annuus]
MVYQMARRDSDYSRARRIADRGNGRDGLDSRARGEDRRLVRRTADRGNDGVDPDPRDLKIKRLQQQVRDLELQHEVRRLKQRIRDLENSSSWKETEPEEPVGDDLSGDEEHPTNDATIYNSPPLYDEYGDEEWYSWVTGGGAVVGSGDELAASVEPVREGPLFGPTIRGVSHLHNLEYLMSFKNQDKMIIAVASYLGETSNSLDEFSYGLTNKTLLSEVENGQIIVMHHISFMQLGIFAYGISMPTLHTTFTRGKQETKAYGGVGSKKFNINAKRGPVKVDNIGSTVATHNGLKSSAQEIQFGSIFTYFKPLTVNTNLPTKVNSRWFNAPFDPGGMGKEPGETTREIEFFGRHMMLITNGIRVDVPFDPGDFDPKAKLEDEFFSKTGSMMQGY